MGFFCLLFYFALSSMLSTAHAAVKTEVGPLDYNLASQFPNLNLDGVLLFEFTGVTQDKDGNFLLHVLGASTSCVGKFAPGSKTASLVAGLGTSTANGILQATSVHFSSLSGLTTDTAGNIYIVDESRHCVRRVGVNGVVNTFAGTCGTSGAAVDGIAATSSFLATPGGAFYHTPTNSLYIADSSNHRIRMVNTATNIITTVMGSVLGNTINFPATTVALNFPMDVWVNPSGVMFVADNVNRRIVRGSSTASVTLVAGTGSSAGAYPSGIAATSAGIGYVQVVTGDTSGNIYFADNAGMLFRCTASNIVFSYASTSSSGVIDGTQLPNFNFGAFSQMFVSSDGRLTFSTSVINSGGIIAQVPLAFTASSTVSVIAGYASRSTNAIPATSVLFRSVSAVWGDTSGAIYVVDGNSCVIVKSTAGIVSSVAGARMFGTPSPRSTAVAIAARLPTMRSILGDRVGNTYFSGGFGVYRISSTGILSMVAGTNVSTGCLANWMYTGQATSVNLCTTRGLAISSSGLLYFADDAFVIRRLVLSTGTLSTIVGRGVMAVVTSPVGFVSTTFALWLDEPRSLLYTVDGLHVVRRVNLADSNPNRTVSVYAGQLGLTTPTGNNLPATSTRFNNPRGICGSSSGDIYVTQNVQYYIRRVFASTQVAQNFVGTGVAAEGGENTDPLITPLMSSLSCFLDESRDTLYYAQTGTNFFASVRSAAPSLGELSQAPTPLPTVIPTLAPSTASTVSMVPTELPTVLPTVEPTFIPTISPTFSPSETPTATPSVVPTASPSKIPTATPSVVPTASPSEIPTATPSVVPTASPSETPTATLSLVPTASHSETPTARPSVVPTATPSETPTARPSVVPTATPSETPTATPSVIPTATPSVIPTATPSVVPTASPSVVPTASPSETPTATPSVVPTVYPSETPTVTPSVVPTATPSVVPTATPSVVPTVSPSETPTATPSETPTASPSVVPTATPSETPTATPSVVPTVYPSETPTITPSVVPTATPSVVPTATPSVVPTVSPSETPTATPSETPTASPSVVPTASPSETPTVTPSETPTATPSVVPTVSPSETPTATPSETPTASPSVVPTATPSETPTTTPSVVPTATPSVVPTATPSVIPTATPSVVPTATPSVVPTASPSVVPTAAPSVVPTVTPSAVPTASPSVVPTATPSETPTATPSVIPTATPSETPTATPSVIPTATPSETPTATPSVIPTATPSEIPTAMPSVVPTATPSEIPTATPSAVPTASPSETPTATPSVIPTATPSVVPTATPSVVPTATPSVVSTASPSETPTVTPSVVPTATPSVVPTASPSKTPTATPSVVPTIPPTATPSVFPTVSPTVIPTLAPSTRSPSVNPSVAPSTRLLTSGSPTRRPSLVPSRLPTWQPSILCKGNNGKGKGKGNGCSEGSSDTSTSNSSENS